MTFWGAGQMRYFTREEWFSIPLKLRQRWWRETNFSREPPSIELEEAIRCVLEPDTVSKPHTDI